MNISGLVIDSFNSSFHSVDSIVRIIFQRKREREKWTVSRLTTWYSEAVLRGGGHSAPHFSSTPKVPLLT